MNALAPTSAYLTPSALAQPTRFTAAPALYAVQLPVNPQLSADTFQSSSTNQNQVGVATSAVAPQPPTLGPAESLAVKAVGGTMYFTNRLMAGATSFFKGS